ncbi:hypothetical protein PN462_07645 [Spirulina sp. CS-785/01]|uniref:hypothetical protein n=1 Tax=Spirulina sp. CS-785/01 TaxID=3021716 RepID=UPI00232ED86F|nr:hypothetical protein [Spirulina sp. CS-785/01]MDB9312970.1 hypothetical protein [Spirulina sp. CS-785/01]
MDYILSTSLYGLDVTRVSDAVGGGGWYSYINIFFYPMSLIAMFYRSNRNIFISNMFLVFLICTIDIISIGTRGIQFFVITTFFLLLGKKDRLKIFIFLIILGVIFLIAFEWTTRVRSGTSSGFVDYWVFKVTESWVNRSIIVNESFVDFIHQNAPVALPLLYFIAYISHSVPELCRFLSEATEYTITPHFLYLKRHYNIVTWGDTESVSATISQMNTFGDSGFGLYQTLYAAFLIDLGLFLLIAILASMAILRIFQVKSLFIFPVYLYFTIVFTFSNITNYFFTGLGPWRFLIFVMFWILFFHFRFKRRSRLKY